MALPGDGDEGRSVGGGAFVINQKKARWGGEHLSREQRGSPSPRKSPAPFPPNFHKPPTSRATS